MSTRLSSPDRMAVLQPGVEDPDSITDADGCFPLALQSVTKALSWLLVKYERQISMGMKSMFSVTL
jgi:hypothetical protein